MLANRTKAQFRRWKTVSARRWNLFRLVLSDDPDVELAQLLAAPTKRGANAERGGTGPRSTASGHGTSSKRTPKHLESVELVDNPLPTETSNEYEIIILHR